MHNYNNYVMCNIIYVVGYHSNPIVLYLYYLRSKMYSNNLGTSLIIREKGLVLLLTQRLFFLKKYCNQMKLEKKNAFVIANSLLLCS